MDKQECPNDPRFLPDPLYMTTPLTPKRQRDVNYELIGYGVGAVICFIVSMIVGAIFFAG